MAGAHVSAEAFPSFGKINLNAAKLGIDAALSTAARSRCLTAANVCFVCFFFKKRERKKKEKKEEKREIWQPR